MHATAVCDHEDRLVHRRWGTRRHSYTQILAETRWTDRGQEPRDIPCVVRTPWVIEREYPRGVRNWWEQSTPNASPRKLSVKGNRRVTCRIVGCERRGRRGVLGGCVALAALDPRCRVRVAWRERGMRLVCVVVPIDTADGTQRRTDPKLARIAPAC